MSRRLLKARNEAGLTQGEAAKRLGGWSQTAISKMELGTKRVNAIDLWELAQLYGKTMDYFLREELDED